ncbi:MAG: aspartate carbamoyltransferase regulatory subunit [Planctomycetes bacterium]|nr:aspartate carbamoyltransferase regulatory subunit [Planctomycetota bacterium]
MSPERMHKQVAALKDGTVVDHLNAGMALKALAALGLQPEHAALLGINLVSRKMGRKDILKLEGRELSPPEIARLAMFGPQATVSLIRDYDVVSKVQVELPETISALLKCPNPKCITNHERIESRFDVEARKPLRARCRYCERRIYEDEFVLR